MSAKINIAMATDLGYLNQTMVVIESIMLKSNKSNTYCFYILSDVETNSIGIQYTHALCDKYQNCDIEFIIMGNAFEDVYIGIPHITKPTYYRLYLPELLDVDRCIYLDSDVIVCDDIANMYAIDMGENEIAGVIAPHMQVVSENQQEYINKIGIPSLKQYINAGVLLMNLSKMRETKYCEKVNSLIDKPFPTQDQDIINIMSYGKIKLLPFKYNVQAVRIDLIKEYPEIGISESELKEAIESPMAIHYSAAEKPWEFLDIPFADKWWDVCRVSNLFDAFLEQYKKSFFYYGLIQKKNIWQKEKYSLSWLEALKSYKKIHVYGAGIKGTRVLKYLKEKGVHINAVLVTSKENNPDFLEGVEVKQISDDLDKDALFIIGTSTALLPQIRRILLDKGYYNVIDFREK